VSGWQHLHDRSEDFIALLTASQWQNAVWPCVDESSPCIERRARSGVGRWNGKSVTVSGEASLSFLMGHARAGGCTWRAFVAVVAASALAVFVGCSRSSGVSFAPVTGRVTVHGKPLAAGTIHFFPDESQGTTGPMSTGVLQGDGRYVLRGPGQRAGAIVGHHRVYLTIPPPDMMPTPIEIDGQVVVQSPARGSVAAMVGRIPTKFLQPETSEWTAAISEGKANVFDFEIKE
jgi:hypothetical protein